MTTRIVRVGNTLMVEIPEDLVMESGLQVGEPLEWVLVGDGMIALERANSSADTRKRMTLEELWEGIPEGVRLGDYD